MSPVQVLPRYCSGFDLLLPCSSAWAACAHTFGPHPGLPPRRGVIPWHRGFCSVLRGCAPFPIAEVTTRSASAPIFPPGAPRCFLGRALHLYGSGAVLDGLLAGPFVVCSSGFQSSFDPHASRLPLVCVLFCFASASSLEFEHAIVAFPVGFCDDWSATPALIVWRHKLV